MAAVAYSKGIIIVSLKEHITGSNFFRNKHSTGEQITQTIDNWKLTWKNKHSALQRMND